MAKERSSEAHKSLAPIGCTYAVEMYEIPGGGYAALCRLPLDASSYREVFLRAPSQNAMFGLINAVARKRDVDHS